MALQCVGCSNHVILAGMPFYLVVRDGTKRVVAICDEKAFALIPRSELCLARVSGMTDMIGIYAAAAKGDPVGFFDGVVFADIRQGSLLFYVSRATFERFVPRAAEALDLECPPTRYACR